MQLIFAWFSTIFRRFLPSLGVLCMVIAITMSSAHAQGMRLIRDAEIERTLRLYADPIFEASGLVPSSISIYILQDDTINAFVMGGSNIFVNTGLITQTTNPAMLIGVLAHETGHISGGHLVRASQAMDEARFRAFISQLLGVTAMASGAGDVGAAIMSAGQHSALRGLLSYTRANEQAADQAALNVLDQLKISASGMMETFEVLRKLENRKIGNPDPYMLTHPLGTERIMHVRGHVESSDIPVGQVPEGFTELHERMLGKLEGFLGVPEEVLTRYTDNNTVRGHYAKAVALFRLARTDQAVAIVDGLLKTSPDDGFFHELKGQILFEGGQVEKSRIAYTKASELLPDEPLIRSAYAAALLAEPAAPELTQEAISHLEYATTADSQNPTAWRLLATAYGRTKRMELSHLALAEEALLLGKPENALKQLEFARKYIRQGTPASLRAEDLRQEANEREKDQKKSKP